MDIHKMCIQFHRLFIDNKGSQIIRRLYFMNKWRHNIFAYFTQADLAYYTYKDVHKIPYTPLKSRLLGWFSLQYCDE